MTRKEFGTSPYGPHAPDNGVRHGAAAERRGMTPAPPSVQQPASSDQSASRDATIAQLKRDNPIAGVIAAHGVALRRSGGRLMAHCPFHDDTHPSFVVYPDTDSFYCFGCRIGGDVITFIRRHEGLSFQGAVARLGGSRPVVAAGSAPERLSLDDRMVLTAACGVYHETLLHHRGAWPAAAYT